MYFLPPGYQQSKNDPGCQVFEKCYSVRDFSLEIFQQGLWVGILGSSSYSLSFQGKVAFSYKIVLSIL